MSELSYLVWYKLGNKVRFKCSVNDTLTTL